MMLVNAEAVDAFVQGVACIDEVLADAPYLTELRDALKLFEKAGQGLRAFGDHPIPFVALRKLDLKPGDTLLAEVREPCRATALHDLQVMLSESAPPNVRVLIVPHHVTLRTVTPRPTRWRRLLNWLRAKG